VYDEATLLESSGPTHMGLADRQALALRRHWGIGWLYNLQHTSQLTSAFFRNCTDLYLFRQVTKSCRLLDESMSLEPGTIEKSGVLALDKYRYVHVQPVVGIVK
jgi:hypothetical protein